MLEPIRKSLIAKASFGVSAVLVFFITIVTVIDARNETRRIIETSRAETRSLAETLDKSLESAMRSGRSSEVQEVLEDVGEGGNLSLVRIFDERGNILRSSDKREVGRAVDRQTLDKAMEGGWTAKAGMEGDSTYTYFLPIMNRPQCYGCHPVSKVINGMLEVRMSREKAIEDIKQNHLFSVKWGLLTILCVALAEIWLLRFLVGRPVRRLREAMRKAARGEPFEIKSRYPDELGELGQAFKGMMEKISAMGRESIEREKELVKAQETEKARSLMSSIIEAMPDGVVIVDEGMRLRLMNRRYRQMFPEAEAGKTCHSVVHDREDVCPHCGVVNVFSDGLIHEHHSQVKDAEGAMRVVHSISAPVLSEEGRIDSAVEVLRDVTERVNLEKSLKEKTAELEKANKQLAKMAVTDGLTLLYNHRFFQESLTKEFKRLARRKASPYLSLAMIDIDHFKKLNDTYGHQAGDFVLKRLSEILKSGVRATDLVSRYGGEEFVIIMPETDLDGMQVVAERIRKTVEDTEFAYEGKIMKVTISVGVANYPKDGIMKEDGLIRAADSALYRAKAMGRNRVVVWGGES